MTAVARGDDPRYFGPGGRVRSARLFPLPASSAPGLGVLDRGRQDMDALYDALAELLGRQDALDPDSETGRRIAEINQHLERLEGQEADRLRAAFEGTLSMPIDTGAALDQEIADVLARHRDRTPDEPAAGEP